MNINFRTQAMVSSTVLGAVIMICLGLIFWERLWSLELRELNDSLCMLAQRDDFYQGEEHRRYLEIDVLNRLGMRVPSDILVKVDTTDGSGGWRSQNWSDDIRLNQMSWHQEDMSDFYIQYEDVLSKRPNSPSFCDQAHIQHDSSDWHLVRVKHGQGMVYLGARLGGLSERLFKFYSAGIAPLILFIVALLIVFATWFSKFISTPIKKLSRAMRHVDHDATSHQLKLETSIHELKELVSSYNQMMGRVQVSITQAQRFSADAAHELKTPLTILQGSIESALSSTSDPKSQQVLVTLQAEVAHLTSITRKLLLLSQADAGNLAIEKKEFDWSVLLSKTVDDAHDLFDSKQVSCSIDTSIWTSGDACLLMRLINNLLTNISKYALPNTPIYISSKRVNGVVETRFMNRGQLMTVEQRDRMFDRFYRSDDPSGTNGTTGTGLGLSLAREIARAYGGDLVLEATALDVFEFKLTLPVVQKAV